MSPALRTAWLLTGGLAAAAVHGQEPVRVAQLHGQEPVQRVEITATEDSDVDKRRRDTVARTVHGREELDRYGDVSVADVLKRLPGVTLQGGSPRLRGLGAGYTLILVNGEPAPPGFSLDNLSPAMVERIEVTRGPTAEHSAQAVAGTINIVLRQALRQRQRELRLALGYNAEWPMPSLNLVVADRWDALSASLPLHVGAWRGRTDFRTDRQALDGQGLPQAWAIETRERWWGHGVNFSPRLSWKVGEARTVDWQTVLQRNDYRSAGEQHTAVTQGAPPPSVDDRYGNRGHWQMLRSSLQVTHKGDDGTRLEARVGIQASSSTSTTHTLGNDAGGVQTIERFNDNANRDRSLTSAGKLSRPLGERHSLALGWDLESRRRREQRSVLENGVPQLLAFEGEPFEARIRRSALFVQDEWELSSRWSAYLGLRAERIGTTSEGRSDGTGSRSRVVTPLLHLNFKPTAGGRDLVRASLTRAYRAPEPATLLGRPSINSSYPVTGGNTELAPDRIGNPALRPELSTGLDLAYEHYLAGGGLLSLGGFERRITGLMRNRVTLQAVPWSPVPRWVSMPVNLAGARSRGVELELKGKVGELLASGAAGGKDWALRLSAAAYRSAVQDLPGPDNRLEGQQPWSLTFGLDRQRAGDPLGLGVSLSAGPAYATRLMADQQLQTSRTRSLDAYLSWAFSRDAVLRLSVSNLWPLVQDSRTVVLSDADAAQVNQARRRGHAWFNAALTLKF